jgi:hypothetical protein
MTNRPETSYTIAVASKTMKGARDASRLMGVFFDSCIRSGFDANVIWQGRRRVALGLEDRVLARLYMFGKELAVNGYAISIFSP